VPLLYFSTIPFIGFLYGIPFLVLAVILFKISLWTKKRNKYGFYGNLVWLFISVVFGVYNMITGAFGDIISLLLSFFIIYLLLKKDVRQAFLKK